MATTTRGIRKVSENILSHGRAIIVTEKDKNKYKWSEIPVGSKFIDSVTGIEMVKLEGESDWVPKGVKNDGTINVVKDSRVSIETFVIKQLEVPGTKREFTYYYDSQKDDAHVRHGIILYKNAMGMCGEYGQYGTYPTWTECKRYLILDNNAPENQYKNTQRVGYVFSLERGDYAMYRNHLKISIDDVLHRTVKSGGVKEVSETRFCLTEDLLENGMEVTAEYIHAFRLGNPYPRTFINPNEPDKTAAEVGDFWLDTDGTLADDDPLGDYIEDDGMIDWARIRPKTRPKSLAGYGIEDKVSYVGHTHVPKDVLGIEKVKVDNARHADTADVATNAGYATNAGHASSADKATDATKAANADKAALATRALSADNATEAKHAASATKANSADNASEANHAVSANKAKNAENADEAKHAATASKADLATKATNADNASEANHAATASKADNATKASKADNATYADKAGRADKATNADNATYAENANNAKEATHAATATKADSATKATSADSATRATNADKAANAENANEAKHALNADNAKEAKHAATATTADSAAKATTANTATKANSATTADIATRAYNADNAKEATHAASATKADNATKATSADNASYATKAGTADSAARATNADNAGRATNDGNGNNIASTYATKNDLNATNNRLNGKEFVKNGTTSKAISFKYETENGKNVVAPYVDGVKIPISTAGILHKAPFSFTPLIDWATMEAKRNGGEKVKNIVNNGHGVTAYGGDTSFSYQKSGGDGTYGDIFLKQSYKNFDVILIHGCNDEGSYNWFSAWETWHLQYAFEHCQRFGINKDDTYNDHYWQVFGSVKHGTNNYTLSTDTFWSCYDQNCGIIEIYGLKF